MYYTLMSWDHDLGWCHADFGGYDYHDVDREMKRRIRTSFTRLLTRLNLKIVAKKRPGYLD